MKKIKKKKRKRKRKNKSKMSHNREMATEFEKVTKRIYEILSPNSQVNHDDKIDGQDSGKKRQIDVSIKSNIAGHEILIIVQCKNQINRVNVNQIGALHSVMLDVGASKGILVSNAGFTSGAKNLSKKRGIDLCSIHDASTRDWRLDIEIPIIWEEITPAISISYKAHFDRGDSIHETGFFNISNINSISLIGFHLTGLKV